MAVSYTHLERFIYPFTSLPYLLPLKCKNMADKQDIRENAMSGGTPTKMCIRDRCGTEYHTWGIITQYGLLNSWEMEQGS